MAISPTGFLIDMDGILYHGESVLPHAIEFMQAIQNHPHVFVTNNPISLPEQVATKLAAIGFNRPEESQIITSGIATAEWLSRQKNDYHYFAIGAEGLHQALQIHGVADEHNADYVVIGEGAGINYESLTTAINLILEKQAILVVTNPDNTVDGMCNGTHCILPGGGALVAPVQVAAGVEPVIIGKPNPLLFEMALARVNVPADQCLMIGDRPDTDIIGAQTLGIKTALVRTGRFKVGQSLPDSIRPDYDIPDLAALVSLLAI